MNKDVVPAEGQILFYTTPDGEIKLDVLFSDETVWLTQKKMAELFDVSLRTINEHLVNIFKTGELIEEATIRKFRIVQKEGNRDVTREVNYTKTLREFIIKGFVLDDERLKNGRYFGKDYFDELLERIREIRASERRFYQKITDIYAQCSIDYDPNDAITKTFYATAQNKLHWAITGQTAAGIIASRADASKANMGLTTWKNATAGKILKPDVSIAKNYLNKKELSELNRVVNMYLDYAELQATRQIPMRMQVWADKLDAFLHFNDYHVLKDAGRISAEVAKKLAEREYEKYRIEQDRRFESDFDREVKKYLGAGNRKSGQSKENPDQSEGDRV